MQIEVLNHKKHSFIFINNLLWMWDTPQERSLQKELAKKAYGDVLVAGYGLGIVTEFLTKNPKVKSITTVEKYKEILDKVSESKKIYGNVIISDFYNVSEYKKYDCVIGDIWPEIDALYLKDYIKFKKKAEKLLKDSGNILAWGGAILNIC